MKITLGGCLYEAVSEPVLQDPEPALMTLKEYLHYRDEDGTTHPDTAYNWTLGRMNDMYRSVPSYYSNPYSAYDFNGNVVIKEHDDIIAVISNGVLYHGKFLHLNKLPRLFRAGTMELRPEYSKTSIVKNPKDIADKFMSVKDYNYKKYNKVVKRIKVGNEFFEIRVNSDYGLDDYALFNPQGYKVAVAQDEFGATLISVASEYRNKGIGDIMLKFWYERNPNYKSGGYTSSGKKMDSRYWAGRVKEFLANGWYSILLAKGAITKDKLGEIVKQAKSFNTNKPTATEEPTIKKELYIFNDGVTFVIYDGRFMDEQIEDYIYGFGFIRSSDDKTYFYKIDYEKEFGPITTVVGFQIMYDSGDRVYIGPGYGDTVETELVPDIVVEGNFAWIESQLIDLKKEALKERKFRKANDKFDEKYNMLIEMAEGKW